MSQSQPFRDLDDDDIRRMAAEAEVESLQLHHLAPGDRRTALWFGRVPLAETTVIELAWLFAVRMAAAPRPPGRRS